jgi:DNA-3-methyladenine glycosylase II
MDKRVRDHFRKVDPILHSVIADIPPVTIPKRTDYFIVLCESIINQQLSEKAGDTIWNRFLSLFPNKKVTPEKVLALPDEKIRSVGTSWSKISYLKNLATHVRQKTLHLHTLQRMSNADVIEELTKVKGIGPWTAEMFLMFSLGREDVFSYGDLGLRNAIKRVYKFKRDPTRTQLEKIVNRWAPYRTWAARILWRSLEL